MSEERDDSIPAIDDGEHRRITRKEQDVLLDVSELEVEILCAKQTDAFADYLPGHDAGEDGPKSARQSI